MAKKKRYYKVRRALPYNWTFHAAYSVLVQLKRMDCAQYHHTLEPICGHFWCNRCALVWDTDHA